LVRVSSSHRIRLLAIITVLLGAGMITYFLAIVLGIQAEGAVYSYLATVGAVLSVSAAFFGVMLSCFKCW